MSNLIVANFKMNGTHAFIEDWFASFNQNNTPSKDIVLALPATYIAAFRDYGLLLSGQNVSENESGTNPDSKIIARGMKDNFNINLEIFKLTHL